MPSTCWGAGMATGGSPHRQCRIFCTRPFSMGHFRMDTHEEERTRQKEPIVTIGEGSHTESRAECGGEQRKS